MGFFSAKAKIEILLETRRPSRRGGLASSMANLIAPTKGGYVEELTTDPPLVSGIALRE
jgi:hypothetical protein